MTIAPNANLACKPNSINDNIARAGLDFNWNSAISDLSANFLASERALNGDRMAEIDGSRTGVRIKIERRVLWQAQFDATRAGVNHPSPSGFAVGFDIAAARFRLK